MSLHEGTGQIWCDTPIFSPISNYSGVSGKWKRVPNLRGQRAFPNQDTCFSDSFLLTRAVFTYLLVKGESQARQGREGRVAVSGKAPEWFLISSVVDLTWYYQKNIWSRGGVSCLLLLKWESGQTGSGWPSSVEWEACKISCHCTVPLVLGFETMSYTFLLLVLFWLSLG